MCSLILILTYNKDVLFYRKTISCSEHSRTFGATRHRVGYPAIMADKLERASGQPTFGGQVRVMASLRCLKPSGKFSG